MSVYKYFGLPGHLSLKQLKMIYPTNKGQDKEPGKDVQPSTNFLNQQNKDSLPYYNTNILKDNTIYKRFNIDAPRYKKRVGIVVIVQSAPREFERRQSVRNTWFQDCENTKNVRAFGQKFEFVILCFLLRISKTRETIRSSCLDLLLLQLFNFNTAYIIELKIVAK